MNLFDSIYPLRLRAAIFFRLFAQSQAWPKTDPIAGFSLALAPVAIRTLHRTDVSHRCIAWTGFYELELSRQLARLATRGGVLVDVGANVGYFSLLWASLAETNQVFAFEPSPRNLVMLETNIREADLSSRIRTFPIALGNSKGQMDFDPGPEEQTGWGGLLPGARSFPVMVEVLDEILSEVGKIAVLKIDTEGADAWVLEGANQKLGRHEIEHVFCEVNESRMNALGIQKERPRHILESHGYRVEELGRSGELHAFLPH